MISQSGCSPVGSGSTRLEIKELQRFVLISELEKFEQHYRLQILLTEYVSSISVTIL